MRHWKARRDRGLDKCDECDTVYESALRSCPKCGPAPARGGGSLLSSTKIGTHFGASPQRINLVLAELGWIEKGPSAKGWVATAQGERRNGMVRYARETGIPYVVWPEAILRDRVLLAALEEIRAPEAQEPAPAPAPAPDRAPVAAPTPSVDRPMPAGTMRAADGHLVRSRGELLIDNWLYMAGILHAYERRLPIEEEARCDFWLPDGRVYIEYWGLEGQPDYEARRKRKLALYAQHNLNLIEITNEDIERLDDVLPPRLLRFGVASK